MGVYLPKPKIDKESEDGGDAVATRYGLTEMQGWRQYMEDAHLSVTKNQLDVGLFGVFDGHGGPAVSKWVSRNFNDLFCDTLVKLRKDTPSEQDSILVGRALQQTFLALDVKMQMKESRDELQTIHALLEEKRNIAQMEENAENGGTQGPSNFLQALLSGQGGKQPVLRIVEQDGQRFVQLLSNEEARDEDGEGEMTSIPIENPESSISNESSAETDTSTLATEQPTDDDAVSPPETANREAPIVVGDVEDAEQPEASEESKLEDASPPEAASPPVEDDEMTGEVTEEAAESMMASEPHQPECCGSTAVVTAIIPGENPQLVIANAGDSRAVLCRDGVAVALSEDHKPHNQEEASRIRKAGGTVVNGRVDGNLNLSRSLGDLFYKKDKDLSPEEQKITAFPDVRITPVTQLDEFLVLACDGIWDCMDNQEVVDFVRARLRKAADEGNQPKLSEICEAICDDCVAANPLESEGIGCDNMTMMIVELGPSLRKNANVDASVQLMEAEGEVSETS